MAAQCRGVRPVAASRAHTSWRPSGVSSSIASTAGSAFAAAECRAVAVLAAVLALMLVLRLVLAGVNACAARCCATLACAVPTLAGLWAMRASKSGRHGLQMRSADCLRFYEKFQQHHARHKLWEHEAKFVVLFVCLLRSGGRFDVRVIEPGLCSAKEARTSLSEVLKINTTLTTLDM